MDSSSVAMDPVAVKIEASLDMAVADLRDFMARARRLRLQFDHAKHAELTAYRKVQSCQESLQYCYANNPFGGMNDIIERRKSQLAEAERQWQEATMFAAQLRSEVAEISEMEIERFQPEVARRMREQDGQELAVCNEMIVDATTYEKAPQSLEAIKVVAKERDIRAAMVYGGPECRPVTAQDRTYLLSRSSPSRGEGTVIAGRIGSPAHYALPDSSSNNATPTAGAITYTGVGGRPASSMGASTPMTGKNAVVEASLNNPSGWLSTFGGGGGGLSSADMSRAQSAATPNSSNRIGSAIAITAYNTSSRAMPTEEPQTSGVRKAAEAAGVLPGLRCGTPQTPTRNDIRPTSQSAMRMTSINFADRQATDRLGGGVSSNAVVVARPGHYGEQTALMASESAEPTTDDAAAGAATPIAGRLTHLSSMEGGPNSYKATTAGNLPPIPLSPAQQRALQHSPFFRPGSALVYAAADAAAVSAQYQDNLENSKCNPLQPHHISRERRPLSRPAYYASPSAEKNKYSVTTPNTPLTESELEQLFVRLDTNGDDLLFMSEVAAHFDKVGTFGVPNHGRKFVATNLKRTFEAEDTVSFDEFSYLVAKWGTL